MVCNNCGTTIEDNSDICPQCGQPTQSIEIPEMRRVINWPYVILLVCDIIFIGIISDNLRIGNSIPFYNILLMIILVIGGLVFLFLCSDRVYQSECPYCGREIDITSYATSMDCPHCKERILIEDYHPSKK